MSPKEAIEIFQSSEWSDFIINELDQQPNLLLSAHGEDFIKVNQAAAAILRHVCKDNYISKPDLEKALLDIRLPHISPTRPDSQRWFHKGNRRTTQDIARHYNINLKDKNG